jgi:hypothetical protein
MARMGLTVHRDPKGRKGPQGLMVLTVPRDPKGRKVTRAI